MAVYVMDSIKRSRKVIFMCLPNLKGGKKIPGDPKLHVLICIGNKRHYAKDGSCAHTAAYLTAMKSDWHRKRTKIEPFGGQIWRQTP